MDLAPDTASDINQSGLLMGTFTRKMRRYRQTDRVVNVIGTPCSVGLTFLQISLASHILPLVLQ